MKRLASAALVPLIRASGLAARSFHLASLRLEQFRFLKLDLQLRAGDVIIASYPRSGTTWLQMLLHQLCTDGEMDFRHISERQPWLERQRDAHPLLKNSRPARLVFKSHLRCGAMPGGPARRIYVLRDGRDVAVSYFHFYRSQLGFRGSFDDFFARFMRGDVQCGSWFRHVHEWLTRADPETTLVVRYEDIKTDLTPTCRRIADFCGIDLTDDMLARVRERCDIRFMKQHQEKFNHWTELLWEKGIEPEAFIRSGEVGGGRRMFEAGHLRLFERESHRWRLPAAPEPPSMAGCAAG